MGPFEVVGVDCAEMIAERRADRAIINQSGDSVEQLVLLDHVRGLEIVTPDGRIKWISLEENGLALNYDGNLTDSEPTGLGPTQGDMEQNQDVK